MNNRKILILFLSFTLLNHCSFDSKTGIWGDGEKEKKRISKLEKQQKTVLKVEKIYSSDKFFNKEILLKKQIKLSKVKNNSSWVMPNLNYRNFTGNLYLTGINNIYLKKKVGKDKFSIYQNVTPILVLKNNIIF